MATERLTHVHSLKERLDETLTANRNEILALLSRLEAKGKGILQHHQVIAEFEEIPEDSRQKLTDGGPAEIIVHGKSGFHIDPYHGDRAADLLVEFFEKVKVDPSHWDKISQGGFQRIEEKYTWTIYFQRLLTLTGVYGFWKHVSNLDRLESRRYLEMFYALKYRKLAESVPLAVE
uniref:sucrose synthase n=1 Tax=Medicago truncatula TaxID=3880 RepID=I3SYC2_MEDTR|nr:unknown [Medicago truncatula]